MSIKEKTVMVTGASSGIGRETALRLGKAEANLALLARREEKLQEAADEIRGEGGSAIVIKTDVTEESQVKTAVEKTVGQYGGIDMLVNVAGLGIFKPVEELSLSEWNVQIEVMLTGAFLATHYALPHIYEKKKGRVLFVTSLWGPTKTAPECSAYNAAKAGVCALARSLREEVKEKGLPIGITEVRPGTVATEFFDKAEYKGGIDPGKVLSAGDVASAIFEALTSRDAIAPNIVELEGTNPPY